MLFGADGAFLASGRAPLDVTHARGRATSPASSSAVAGTAAVARYRVGFRGEDGRIIGHVDRARSVAARIARGRHDATRVDAHRRCCRGSRSPSPPSQRSHAAAGRRRSFRFRTGVELINVTATVTDASGRFVSGLRKEDFRLFEDGQEQQITHFNSERVPVSLGIVVDTSGSMEGEKMDAARRGAQPLPLRAARPERRSVPLPLRQSAGARRGLDDRSRADRDAASAGFGRAAARRCTTPSPKRVPLAQTGRHRKKALVIISDGNDTNSRDDRSRGEAADPRDRGAGLRDRHRQRRHVATIGGRRSGARSRRDPPAADAVPGPDAGSAAVPDAAAAAAPQPPPTAPIRRTAARPAASTASARLDDRVNVAALRDITDDSGGRTEIVRSARDLDPATASIADELSKQYYLGYPSQAKRTAAGTPSASKCATAGISCARAAATSRRHSGAAQRAHALVRTLRARTPS